MIPKEKQHSALEWYAENFAEHLEEVYNIKITNLSLLTKAKKIEKQQIGYSEEDLRNAFHCGKCYKGRELDIKTFSKELIEQISNGASESDVIHILIDNIYEAKELCFNIWFEQFKKK